MVLERLLIFTAFFLTAILPVSAQEKSSLYIDTLNEVDKILGEHHFFKNTAFENSDAIEELISNIDQQNLIFTDEEVDNYISLSKNNFDLGNKELLEVGFDILNDYKKRYKTLLAHQSQYINELNEIDLFSSERIHRNREDQERFNSLSMIKNYYESLAKSELISIMIKEEEFEKSVNKLKKRLNRRLKNLEQLTEDDLFSWIMNSKTSLYDPHSNYMTPRVTEDFEINMSLSLEGIGAMLTSDDGITKITKLIKGGPAIKSGLIKNNDQIVGVGTREDSQIVDVRDWRVDEVVKLIRGPKGTIVKLEILPSSSPPEADGKVIEIKRDLVKLEDQAAKKQIIEVSDIEKSYKFGVIDLPAFYMDFEGYQKNRFNYRSATRDVKKLIKEIDNENSDGVILDLRGNGGGSLYEAYSLAKIFLGRGNVLQVMTSNGSIYPLGHSIGIQNYSGPVLILVDKMSASASEILAGAIQDYGRGLVVGSQTFGKGTVQRLRELPYGQLKYTEQKFYRVTGESTQNKGVTPDIELPFVFNSQEVGESSYDNSLEEDFIKPLRVTDFRQVKNIKRTDTNSKNRNNANFLTSYIDKKNSLSEDRDSREFIDLDLAKRIDEQNEYESNLLSLENDLRRNLDLQPFKNFDEYLDADDEERNKKFNDLVLKEAAKILIDQIEFNADQSNNLLTVNSN